MNVIIPTRVSGELHELRTTSLAHLLETSGAVTMRYGLVLIILWFGAFKFTPTEAGAIQPLVSHSPLLSWLYDLADVRTASAVIGIVEILTAVLIALRPWKAGASAIGSLAACGMFITTVSFMFTTPGSFAWVDGMFVPAGAGGFIIKDLVLLAAALWTAGEALAAASAQRANHRPL
jgi:uncharacterized membrane protein YkgB